MTQLPGLCSIEPWLLAARLASTPEATPWTLIAAPVERIEGLAAEIAVQLASLLDVEVVRAHVTRPEELFDLIGAHPNDPLVIDSRDSLDADAWRRIDLGRSRLAHDPPTVLVLEERRLPLVVDHAPNLWSWFGGSVWHGQLEDEPAGPGRS